MASAASKVFDIYELHEQILLNLKITTLFAVQRVDKTWHFRINDSQAIQRKMWLTSKDAVLTPKDTNEWGFPPEYEAELQLCPALRFRYSRTPRSCKFHGLRDVWTITKEAIISPKDNKRGQMIRSDADSQQASWRNILVTQPPITAVRFLDIDGSVWTQGPYNTRRSRIIITNANGITFGDICDARQSLAAGFLKKVGKELRDDTRFGFELVDAEEPDKFKHEAATATDPPIELGPCTLCKSLLQEAQQTGVKLKPIWEGDVYDEDDLEEDDTDYEEDYGENEGEAEVEEEGDEEEEGSGGSTSGWKLLCCVS